jgi:hypothetical protein
VQQEAEAELEALRSSTVRVQDLVLGDVDGSSSLVTSMPAVVERLEGQIDTVATNGVRWGSRFSLVAFVSQFSELDADLEVLGSRRNVGLTEGEVDALWSQVRAARDSLASHVHSLVSCNPPDKAG